MAPPIGGIPFGTGESGGGSSVDGITELTTDVVAVGPGVAVATIQPNAVTTGKIANNAVTTAKIADQNVTDVKLVNGALAAGEVLGTAMAGPVTRLPFGPVARNLGLASTTTEAKQILDIADYGDLRNYAIARAKELLGFTPNQYPTVALDEPFVSKIGVSSSFFAGAGTGSVTDLDTRAGGWKTVAGNAAGQYYLAANNTGGGNLQVISPANTTDHKWYMLALFSIDQNYGNFGIGFIDPTLNHVLPSMGVRGILSTTKFCFTNNVNSALSTVDIDNGVHIGEMWCDGDGSTVYGSIDGETPVSFDSNQAYAMSPWIFAEGSESQSIGSVGHLCIVTPQS